MKSELAEDLRPFFTQGQNVRRVLIERPGYKLDVSNELLMTNKLRSQRSSKREVRMKDLRH